MICGTEEDEKERTWKEDGLGGERDFRCGREQTTGGKEKKGRRQREGEMEARIFSCLARLRSCRRSVSELDAEISY